MTTELVQKIIALLLNPEILKAARARCVGEIDRWHCQLTRDYLYFWREGNNKPAQAWIRWDKNEYKVVVQQETAIYIDSLTWAEIQKHLTVEEKELLNSLNSLKK